MYIEKILTEDDFKKMEDLEQKFYDDSHITPYQEAYEWYLKYPYSISVLKDNNNIIGFINMFPIKNNIFNEIKLGIFNDKNLTTNCIVDISDTDNEEINMFLCCIVVDSEYRNKNITAKLIKESLKPYKNIFRDIKNIITDNVTKEGEKLSANLGLKFVCDTIYESKIYMVDFNIFIEKLEN